MIEPTEEQKQAARSVSRYTYDIARLLAEREASHLALIAHGVEVAASLRAELEHFRKRLVETDTDASDARARVAELEAREQFRDLAAEVDTGEPVDALLTRTLSARVAELEADVKAAAGELLVEIPEPGSVVARLLLANTAMRRQRDALAGDRVRDAAAMDARMQEREAQHLADIKALREGLRHSRGAVCYWVKGSGSPSHYIKDLKTIDAVLASTAHYDDAKADAPASTEGEATDE